MTWLLFCPRHQPWIEESPVFKSMKVEEELSQVLGISDLSGRGVQWGVNEDFKKGSWWT